MRKDRKQAGRHDWDGNCKPGGIQQFSSQTTFSVGIFKWLTKARGKGLKRSAVVYRVKGSVERPECVYMRAEIICDCLDVGVVLVRKSETVR